MSLLLAAVLFAQNRSVSDEGQELIAKAMATTKEGLAAAAADPERPTFHFHAPAQWMNDPNGPIYYKGWYHLFYQFNPYGNQWGNMHWGHARSRDMIHWEHLPVALWPSKSLGEEHVFSGSTFLDGHGKPRIFYTSIGHPDPEQWMAEPLDDDLIRWQKSPGNPVVSVRTHAPVKIDEWRDPFLFTSRGVTYMVTGGRHEGHGSVELYRAENPELTAWKYRGILFQHPDSNLVECPNLVKLGDKIVLLTSHDGRVDWFSGRIENEKFVPERRGVLAPGSYASQLLKDRYGRCIHLAWVPTSDRTGWNGYLTIPSVLTLDRKGDLCRRPIRLPAEGPSVEVPMFDLTGERDLPESVHGDRLHITAMLQPGTAQRVEIIVRAPRNGPGGAAIVYDAGAHTLNLPGREPLHLDIERSPKLEIYIDKSAIDVYAGDGEVTACAVIHSKPGDDGIRIRAAAGTAKVRLFKVEKLKAISSAEGV